MPSDIFLIHFHIISTIINQNTKKLLNSFHSWRKFRCIFIIRCNTSVKKISRRPNEKLSGQCGHLRSTLFSFLVSSCILLLVENITTITIYRNYFFNFKHGYQGIASFITIIPMANRFLQIMYHTLKKMSSLA